MKKLEKSKTDSSENGESPMMYAFEQCEDGMVHILTDDYGFELFKQFLSMYKTNVPEHLLSEQEH